MAVLQKIRQKSLLLILVIGFSLFAFIIGGLLKGGLSSLSRNVGEINGESISTQSYMNKVENLKKQGQNSSRVYQQVWDAEVRSILYPEQFNKVGLRLGKDQMINTIKSIPDFANNPQYKNEAGEFDMNKLNQFLAELKKQGAQKWNAWLDYEVKLSEYALQNTYLDIIKGSIITTSLEAKQVFSNQGVSATFDYVALPFSKVNDKDVEVTNEEIKKYIDKHPKQFKAEPSRTLQYVFIENKPSTEDKQEVKNQLNQLLINTETYNPETKVNEEVKGFKLTTDPINFVNENSDVPFDSTYIALDKLPKNKEAMKNMAVGELFGPYEDGDYISISKILSKDKFKDNVTASHILIAFKGADRAAESITISKEDAEKKAKELLTQVKANPSSFAEVAKENTNDEGSKSKGGQYKNINKGQMVPEFDKFIFSNPIGNIGLVETNFGYHIIKVDAISKKDGLQIATISKTLEVSNATQDNIHMLATKFEEQVETKEFSELARELKIVAHPEIAVTSFQDQLPVVGKQREAIQWAFNSDTETNNYKRFSTADGELIVKITNVNDTNLMTVKQAESTVKPILLRNKKISQLMSKMAGQSIEEIAKTSGQSIKSAKDVTLANPLVSSFQEPKVVGMAIGMDAEKLSNIIEGANGLYVIKTKSVKKSPELPNYESFKSNVKTNNRISTTSGVYNALLNNADIEDNRSKILIN